MLQKARYKGLSVSKLEGVIDKTERGLEDYRTIYDAIFDESMENSSDYLGKVKEFMTTFGQPVLGKPTALPEDRQKLRIALIFEELKEYAEASGLIYSFIEMCDKASADSHNMTQVHPHPTHVDQVEQLDALLDLQYVLSGAVHEHGFGEIFDEAFEEVHNSNMSKACQSELEAIDTAASYFNQNVSVKYDPFKTPIVIYREKDNKVLKSIDYKPAQLAQFLK